MIIGFTGTQLGLTEYQKEEVRYLLQDFDWSVFHHGNCIGADEEAGEIAMLGRAPSQEVVAHPCNIYNKTSKSQFYTHIEPIQAPLTRNRIIVDACDFLIACPKANFPVTRSGTWATIRYADQRKVSHRIIYPDSGYTVNFNRKTNE